MFVIAEHLFSYFVINRPWLQCSTTIIVSSSNIFIRYHWKKKKSRAFIVYSCSGTQKIFESAHAVKRNHTHPSIKCLSTVAVIILFSKVLLLNTASGSCRTSNRTRSIIFQRTPNSGQYYYQRESVVVPHPVSESHVRPDERRSACLCDARVRSPAPRCRNRKARHRSTLYTSNRPCVYFYGDLFIYTRARCHVIPLPDGRRSRWSARVCRPKGVWRRARIIERVGVDKLSV